MGRIRPSSTEASNARNSENRVPVTILYDAEIIAAFESSGERWQQRMNDALFEWLKTNTPRNVPDSSAVNDN
jgi:uncharacterized protein (DUF4415 family)